jgi:hypothetical protein
MVAVDGKPASVGADRAKGMIRNAEDERHFHLERAEQCRRMADDSTDPAVRRLHVELAEFHEAEARKTLAEVPAAEGAE